MALVQKIDVNAIFASNAPMQDTPAEFDNYTKGMDETRKNEGRPTIKQFNFIQQSNDQKILWIHQNGGALPHDPLIEYAVGSVVLKDGRLKKWDGSVWVNFGSDDSALKINSNLSDVQDKAEARNNLDVYSKSDSLAKNNNLSDLGDVTQARDNLSVYSKTHIDSELLKKANVTGEFTYFSALMNTIYVNNNDFDITIYAGFRLPANSNVDVQINADVVGFCTNYNTSNSENFQTVTFRVPSKATYKFNTIAGTPVAQLVGWQP